MGANPSRSSPYTGQHARTLREGRYPLGCQIPERRGAYWRKADCALLAAARNPGGVIAIKLEVSAHIVQNHLIRLSQAWIIGVAILPTPSPHPRLISNAAGHAGAFPPV